MMQNYKGDYITVSVIALHFYFIILCEKLKIASEPSRQTH